MSGSGPTDEWAHPWTDGGDADAADVAGGGRVTAGLQTPPAFNVSKQRSIRLRGARTWSSMGT